MCGHDWCSMRISKEISEFASGKDPAFQPARRAVRSPGVGDDGRELLASARRSLPVVDGKHACHSDLVDERRGGAADSSTARATERALLKPDCAPKDRGLRRAQPCLPLCFVACGGAACSKG